MKLDVTFKTGVNMDADTINIIADEDGMLIHVERDATNVATVGFYYKDGDLHVRISDLTGDKPVVGDPVNLTKDFHA